MAKSEKFTGENSIFAQRLKDIMKERKITQQQLADELNMTRQAVSLYLTGQALPSVDKLLKICDYFGVSADYLIGKSNVKSQDENIKMICKYTGLSEDSANNLCDIVFEQNDVKESDEDVYKLKQATLFFVNAILENRATLNAMAINFNEYYSLLADVNYDPNIITLQDGLNWYKAECAVKDCGLCVIPKEEMQEYRFYSFINTFSKIIKEAAIEKARYEVDSSCPQ